MSASGIRGMRERTAAGKSVLITVHDRRGVETMGAASVLPRFRGIAVRDGWAPDDTCDQATHARCNAHVLRELQAATDHRHRSGHTGRWCWAAQAETLCGP